MRFRDARSFPFVQLAAYYLDGKPVEWVAVTQSRRLIFPPMGTPLDLGEEDFGHT